MILREAEMRNVTPDSNFDLLMKSLGYAAAAVIIIAFLKIALKAFLSVVVYIIPIAAIIFLFMKFGGKK